MKKYQENASFNWSDDSIRLINTPSQNAKSIYYYVQEAGYFKTTPPYFTEREGLPSFLILYTISGSGILHYEEEDYTLSAGQCFFINCMNHHEYHTTDLENSWEFLWVHFYGSNSLGYYEEFVKSGFRIASIQDTFLFDSTIRRIISIHQKKQFDCEILTSKLLTDLLTELLILRSTQSIELLQTPDYIRQTVKFIDIHFQEDLTLSVLSSQVNISKYHLSREFSKYAGTTINEYVITKRIGHAKELLKYTTISISEIASECGIHNVSHFINLFKAREGTTPLTYRQTWSEKAGSNLLFHKRP